MPTELLLLGLLVFGGLWWLFVSLEGKRPTAKSFFASLVVLAVLAFGAGCGGSVVSGGSSFCDKHECIPSFYAGEGSVVQCVDGMWSHSGGVQGACSSHGGVGGSDGPSSF